MYCSSCGALLRDGAQFCGKCGEQVPNDGDGYERQIPVAPVGKVPSASQPPSPPRTVDAIGEQSPAKSVSSSKSQGRNMPKPTMSLRTALPVLEGLMIWGLLVLAMGAMAGGLGASSSQYGSGKTSGVTLFLEFVAAALFIICAFKESATTGLYKTFGVYGRIKAFLVFNFGFGGLLSTVALPFMIVTGHTEGLATALGGAVIGDAVSIAAFAHSYAKCPEMLKPRLFVSMLISGLGVTTKVTFFFLVFFFHTIWALEGPREMVDERGVPVYVYNGYVYDRTGWKIGVLDPYDSNKYVKIN